MVTSLFSKSRNLKVGFTLIELLVVIAIIGVLASIVLASLNTARRKSRDARRISDVKQIQLALELCFDAGTACNGTESNSYPDGTGELDPTYIPTVPLDPNGVAYIYHNLDGSTGGACDEADAGNCLYYHLGGILEESTNNALTNDADPGTAANFGFSGATNDCAGDPAGGETELCYDVTP